MLPRRVDDDKFLEKVPMSSEQYARYLQVRWDEIQRDSRGKVNPDKSGDEELKSFRVNSRLVCNYAVPPELREAVEDVVLNRKVGAGDTLIELATRVKGAAKEQGVDLAWREWSIDKRLEGHDEDIQEQRHNCQKFATRQDLEKLRETTEAKHTELERDVKNLGQQLSEVVRREVDTLRTEQQRQAENAAVQRHQRL
jgi:hypothetical protein